MIRSVGITLALLAASIGGATSAELTVPMKTQHTIASTSLIAIPVQDAAVKSATADRSLKRKNGGT